MLHSLTVILELHHYIATTMVAKYLLSSGYQTTLRYTYMGLHNIRYILHEYYISRTSNVTVCSRHAFRTSLNNLYNSMYHHPHQFVGTNKSPCAHVDSKGPFAERKYIHVGPHHKNLPDIGP